METGMRLMKDGKIQVLLIGGSADGTRVEAVGYSEVIRIANRPKMYACTSKISDVEVERIHYEEYHIHQIGQGLFVATPDYNTPWETVMHTLLDRYPPQLIKF